MMCLYCGKDFNPHTQYCGEDFYPLMYCSWKCYRKSQSIFGKIKLKLENIRGAIWYRTLYKLQDYIHYETCPLCNTHLHYVGSVNETDKGKGKYKMYLCMYSRNGCHEGWHRYNLIKPSLKARSLTRGYMFTTLYRPDFFYYFKLNGKHRGLHIFRHVYEMLLSADKIQDGKLCKEEVHIVEFDDKKGLSIGNKP